MNLMNILKNIVKKEEKQMDFNKLATEWLMQRKIRIKESTYSKYEYVINRYLFPKLKNMNLEELQKYNFNELVAELMESLSTKSIRDIICILKGILYYANDEYSGNLKIKRITSPKLNIENIVIMSKREKSRLENYCLKENTLKSIGIVICLNTGLRIGEICALRWENINLEKRTLSVKNTLQRIYDNKSKSTKVIIDVPKTRKSIREIPISNKLYELLKPLKKKYKDKDFFLTGNSEKYIEPRNYQFYFKSTLKKCKIKPYKFHQLRHFFATECIEVGMDVKTLSVILGHSSVDVTLNRYVHTDLKKQKKYLERL